MIGTNYRNHEAGQAYVNLAREAEAPRRQQKIQKLEQIHKIEQHQEPHIVKMVPSISNHTCTPSSSLSPPSIQISIVHQRNDFLSDTVMKSVNLESLVSTNARNKLETIQESNPKKNAQHENQNTLNLFVQENVEAVSKNGFENCATLEGTHKEEKGDNSACEYDDMVTPMIIDSTENVCSDASESTITNDHSFKAFCPNRLPRKSCIKGSERSQTLSPHSTKRALGDTFQILLPGCIEPVVRRRTIVFYNDISILKIEPIRLLAIDGPKSLWYQQSEYEAIKFKTLALLDRVDHPTGIVDGKKYCTRGLEKFMNPETSEVKKHQAWDSVLNEQFLQRKDGECDEQALANIYKFSTNRSQKEALKRGKIDAEAAEAYLKNISLTFSSSVGIETQPSFNRRVSL